MVLNCTIPGGVGSITASGKKLQEGMLMVCAQCLVWSLWIHIASLSLFELFGLSFVRAGKNGDLIAQAQRKTFVPIVVKVHSGRQSKWPLGKPLLANIAILDTEFRSCWHHLKNKTEVRWTWSQIAWFSWGVISAEWPARLTLHRRLRAGWVDRIKGRISHSVEGPKFVPFPCGRPFPSPLSCENIAAGCLCLFQAAIPFKSFGWIVFEARSCFQQH